MKSIFKKGTSLLLSLVMSLSVFTGLGTTVSAAGVKSEAYMISFPRSNDVHVDYSGSWGNDELSLMNGWSLHSSRYTTLYTVNNYSGPICYCIEPGIPVQNGDAIEQKGENYWDNYPAEYNNTIEPDTIKLLIGRILQYGYTGNISASWVTQNPEGANKIAKAYATQILVWETIVGERDENFAHVDTGGKNRVKEIVRNSHPLKELIFSYYDDIVSSVQTVSYTHLTLPTTSRV